MKLFNVSTLRKNTIPSSIGQHRFSFIPIMSISKHLTTTNTHNFLTYLRSISCLASSASPSNETFEYVAEVDRVMDMIVNSLYSNKDVFLRELISNSSDALDKVRLASIKHPEVLQGRHELGIRIKALDDANTLIIEDDGIGMTREELINNLGTIASSGTAKFVESLNETKDSNSSNQIGQFGVGFYSVFLVANKVKVQSLHPNETRQWVWTSTSGSHRYEVYADELGEPILGTRITLHLKDDSKEYLNATKLKSLIKQFSEFITFPIKIWLADDIDKQVVDELMSKKRQEFEDKKAKEEGREPSKVEPVMKTEWGKEWKYLLINDSKPLWQKNPKEVSIAEYNQFYKETFKEFLEPLAYTHYSVEGMYEFKGLIFIPGLAAFDVSRDVRSNTNNIRLYVKKVFLGDSFHEELVPNWLSYIKGVIDSADLPLNVSRELLQESRVIRTIRKQIVTRCLSMITSLQDDKEKWKKFWDSFGKEIKLGVVEDNINRLELARVCRFQTSYQYSTSSDDSTRNMSTLDEYVCRMKTGQEAIYFFATYNLKTALKVPFVERLIKTGYEVLFLTDPLDEYVAMNLAKYSSTDSTKEYALIDVTRENIDISNLKLEESNEKMQKKFDDLCGFIKFTLKDKIDKVIISSRLDSSPCVLVTSKFGWSANMERIMKAQAGSDARAYEYMRGKRSMEINTGSKMICSLRDEIKKDKESNKARDIVNFMFQTSLLTSGFDLEDPQTFAKTVYGLMERSMKT